MTFCLDSIIIRPENDAEIKNALFYFMVMVVMEKILACCQLIGKDIYQIQFLFVQMVMRHVSINPSGYQWFDLTKDDPKLYFRTIY